MSSICKKKLKKLKWLWIVVAILGVLYIIPSPEKEEVKEEVVKVKEEKKLTFDQVVKKDIEKELGTYNNEGKKYVDKVQVIDNVLIIKLNANKGISVNNMVSSMNSDVTKILELVKDKEGFGVVHIQMFNTVVDSFGNNDMRPLLDVRLKKETLDKINFEGFLAKDLPLVVEAYGLDSSLR